MINELGCYSNGYTPVKKDLKQIVTTAKINVVKKFKATATPIDFKKEGCFSTTTKLPDGHTYKKVYSGTEKNNVYLNNAAGQTEAKVDAKTGFTYLLDPKTGQKLDSTANQYHK